MTVEKTSFKWYEGNGMVFEKKMEKVQKWLFFGHFWANFGCFSHPIGF